MRRAMKEPPSVPFERLPIGVSCTRFPPKIRPKVSACGRQCTSVFAGPFGEHVCTPVISPQLRPVYRFIDILETFVMDCLRVSVPGSCVRVFRAPYGLLFPLQSSRNPQCSSCCRTEITGSGVLFVTSWAGVRDTKNTCKGKGSRVGGCGRRWYHFASTLCCVHCGGQPRSSWYIKNMLLVMQPSCSCFESLETRKRPA